MTPPGLSLTTGQSHLNEGVSNNVHSIDTCTDVAVVVENEYNSVYNWLNLIGTSTAILQQFMKKDYTVLLIQLDRNLASDVSTRCSGRPQGNENWCQDSLIYRLYLRAWLLIIWRVIM